MNIITKAIKNTLRIEYPESTISVRIRRATNYVDSSDKILVYVSDATYADIKTTLVHCTNGIAIYPAGGVAAKGGICAPQVWDAKTREFVDADMCEFIEIKTDGAE